MVAAGLVEACFATLDLDVAGFLPALLTTAVLLAAIPEPSVFAPAACAAAAFGAAVFREVDFDGALLSAGLLSARLLSMGFRSTGLLGLEAAFVLATVCLAGAVGFFAVSLADPAVATLGGLAAFFAAALARGFALNLFWRFCAAFLSPWIASMADGVADLVRSRRVFFCTDVSPIPVYRLPDCRIKAFVTSFGDQSMSCLDSCKPMLNLSAIPGGVSGARLAVFRKSAVVAVAAGLLGACTPAGDPNHPLRGAATQVGLATTVGEPKDFVKASRSGRELAYIPIGRGGLERPIAVRNAAGVKSLESELDRQRDAVEATARRRLPRGAYGQPFPSVAAPPRPEQGAAAGQPDSYPVSANRMRQIRSNAQRAKDND